MANQYPREWFDENGKLKPYWKKKLKGVSFND